MKGTSRGLCGSLGPAASSFPPEMSEKKTEDGFETLQGNESIRIYHILLKTQLAGTDRARNSKALFPISLRTSLPGCRLNW